MDPAPDRHPPAPRPLQVGVRLSYPVELIQQPFQLLDRVDLAPAARLAGGPGHPLTAGDAAVLLPHVPRLHRHLEHAVSPAAVQHAGRREWRGRRVLLLSRQDAHAGSYVGVGEVQLGVVAEQLAGGGVVRQRRGDLTAEDRKSTRLNSSHGYISYAV